VNNIGSSPPSVKVSAEAQAKPPLDKDNGSFVIGEAAAPFSNVEKANGNRLSLKKETALGDMTCDGTAWYAREVLGDGALDFVYLNGGIFGNTGIEKAGPITVGDIRGILPYSADCLTILTMKGSALQELFNHAAQMNHSGSGGGGTGGWGMVSKEVRYTLDYSYLSAGQTSPAELKDLTIHGQPLDPDRNYRIGTSSCLVEGGDGYWMFIENGTSVRTTGYSITNVVMDYIYAQDLPLVPQTDGRVTLIGGAIK
jgi:5'-nucleotidase/UDP-sugar diphosphatase